MVSDIELEIAMTIIQLTAISLPVLLGIARYYFKNKDEIDTTLENHPELPADISPEDFVSGAFLMIGLALFIAFFLSVLLINQLNNFYLIFAINVYGVFLIIVLLMIPIALGSEVKPVIYRLFALGLFIPGLLLFIAAFLSLYEGLLRFALMLFGSSLLFLIPSFFIFRAAERANAGADADTEGEGDDPAAPAAAERELD